MYIYTLQPQRPSPTSRLTTVQLVYPLVQSLASRSGIVLNFLSNSTIALDHNLVEVLGRLDWVGLLIHPLQLL